MKPTVVSADVLFEDHRGTLHWEWVAGLGASERRFDEVAIREARSGADLVGYLNYIHPYRLQILGVREVAYLTNATPEDCARRIARIVTLEPPVLVLADGQAAPPALLSMCERAQLPMFSTRESSAFVIDVLRAYLSKHFADRTSMHGVFMDILGLGVMITGESGLGKSELGLELDAARRCCRTCWKSAASACWTSAPFLVRPRCGARCASSSSCIWCGARRWSGSMSGFRTNP